MVRQEMRTLHDAPEAENKAQAKAAEQSPIRETPSAQMLPGMGVGAQILRRFQTRPIYVRPVARSRQRVRRKFENRFNLAGRQFEVDFRYFGAQCFGP